MLPLLLMKHCCFLEHNICISWYSISLFQLARTKSISRILSSVRCSIIGRCRDLTTVFLWSAFLLLELIPFCLTLPTAVPCECNPLLLSFFLCYWVRFKKKIFYNFVICIYSTSISWKLIYCNGIIKRMFKDNTCLAFNIILTDLKNAYYLQIVRWGKSCIEQRRISMPGLAPLMNVLF